MNKNKHVIDMIFPIALFFVFISSCFIVLILSFHTYRKAVQLEQSNYQTRTALPYITQKIHQNDLIDSVSLQQIDQKDVLVLKSSYSQGKYTTYLYEDKGYLKELFISNQLEFDKDDGKKIMPASHLKMQQINPYLYHFSCIVDHKEINTNVAIQSK